MSVNITLPETDTFFRNQPNVRKWGEHEFTIIQKHLKTRRLCIDIGAHVGLTTLRFAQYFDVVHSFEPIHHELLARNTEHLSNVTPHAYAVSDVAGTVDIYPNPINSGGGIIPADYNTSTIQKRYTGSAAQMKDVSLLSVDCIPIDSFNFCDVDLIKIDVEGYTLPVLTGMVDTLDRNSPVIQMELSFESQNQQTHQILIDLGYVTYEEFKRDRFYYKK